MCTKIAYESLNSVRDSHPDWAHTLLMGVFGEEAQNMRVKAVKQGTKAFPKHFLMVAKCRFSVLCYIIWCNS